MKTGLVCPNCPEVPFDTTPGNSDCSCRTFRPFNGNSVMRALSTVCCTVDCCVFTSDASPVIVMDSEIEPISRGMLIVIKCPTWTVTPDCENDLNPGAEALSV